MNFLFVVAATISLIVAPVSFFLFFSMERYRKRAKQLEVQLATVSAQAEALQREADDIKELRRQNSALLEQKSVAVTELSLAQKKLDAALSDGNAYLREKEQALSLRMEAEKKLELIQQKMQETDKRMQDWELQRAESLKAAKASILEAGGQLSSKLLEDHKRETEAARKDAEAAMKKNSEALSEQMVTVTKTLAVLQSEHGENRNRLDTVWKSLTTPAGAGYLAEIGLENSLKNLALEPGRDYVMQYAINTHETGSLRPDAVIFLQQDMVMVIDSKASKFVMEIAEAQDETAKAEAAQRLRKTMNDHLKALKDRDYRAAIEAMGKEAGRQISHVHTVMYLPNESAISHLKSADPEFVQKTEKAGIILAGPTSLHGLLNLAQFSISMDRQAENHDLILKTVQELMDTLITVLSHADKIGRGIKSTADNFDQFSRSVNKRLLPKLQKLASFGVKAGKPMPARIVSYDVRLSDEMLTIEGEAEMVEDVGVIENFPRQKATA